VSSEVDERSRCPRCAGPAVPALTKVYEEGSDASSYAYYTNEPWFCHGTRCEGKRSRIYQCELAGCPNSGGFCPSCGWQVGSNPPGETIKIVVRVIVIAIVVVLAFLAVNRLVYCAQPENQIAGNCS
jgi:hypothetical protein